MSFNVLNPVRCGLLVLFSASAPRAQDAGDKRPLVLAAQGSFFVGGSIEFRDPNSSNKGETREVPGSIAINHMYVQYQIPKDRKYRYAMIINSRVVGSWP